MDTKWKDKLKDIILNFSIIDLILIFLILGMTFFYSELIYNKIYNISNEIGEKSFVKTLRVVGFSDDKEYYSLLKNNSEKNNKKIFDETSNFIKNTLNNYKNLQSEEDIDNFIKRIMNNYYDISGIVLVNNTKQIIITNEPGMNIENYINGGENNWDQKTQIDENGKLVRDAFYKDFKNFNMEDFLHYLKNNKYNVLEHNFTVNEDSYSLIMFKINTMDINGIYYHKKSVKVDITILMVLIILNILYITKFIYNIRKYKRNFIRKTISNEPIIKWYINKSLESKIKANILVTIMLILFSYVIILMGMYELLTVIIINCLIIALLIFANIYRLFGVIRLKEQLKNIIEGKDVTLKLFGLKDIEILLNDITRGYNKAVSENIKNEKLKTELITNVSHDLKTPLTSIINYVDILKREDLTDDEKKDYLEILDRKTNKLKGLINDLFEISKLSSGKVDLEIDKVDLMELLHQSLGECATSYAFKNIDFKINSDVESLKKFIDGKKFSRVFENLIINAYKYSLENTRVYIDVQNLDNSIIIAFKNISSYELNFNGSELFERFTRGDLARTSKVEGSGLGLAIAKSIVELHSGEMKIDIEGDMFKVYIILNK